MKPQKQLFRHRPDEGIYGDCHRTAIAIVLGMDAKDVPHFMDGAPGRSDLDAPEAAERAHNEVEAWLNARGICTINVLFPGDISLDEVLRTISLVNTRSRPVFILGGQSKNGVNHSVVCCDGEIACDPALDDSGIVGPCDDGFYWVTFFGSLQASNVPARGGVAEEIA